MNDKERKLMRDLEMTEAEGSERVMAEVVKVEDCGSSIGDYDIPIHNAIIIPEGATNGDMIKAMFPNCEVSIHEYMAIKCGVDVKIYFFEDQYFTVWFPASWYNAPYKKEVEE